MLSDPQKLELTDAELQGVALAGLNMAKRDRSQGRFSCLLATYYQRVGLHRMEGIEQYLVDHLGEDWLNDDQKKTYAFQCLRLAMGEQPVDAFVFVSAANMFHTTAAFEQLSQTEQAAIINGGHVRHHQAVAEGLMTIEDSFHAVAQTPTRVCFYVQPVANGEFVSSPEVNFTDQAHFTGRMKLFGSEEGDHGRAVG